MQKKKNTRNSQLRKVTLYDGIREEQDMLTHMWKSDEGPPMSKKPKTKQRDFRPTRYTEGSRGANVEKGP